MAVLGFAPPSWNPPVVKGDEALMDAKAHGTSRTPVQAELRWGCEWALADRICNFNRHAAETRGYYQTTLFPKWASQASKLVFFDSNSGRLLFTVPAAQRNATASSRSIDSFLKESKDHGWPSFRNWEVNWKQVRVLPNGEVVSLAGTHLGHNLPDYNGNRYCINLVSIAGHRHSGGVPSMLRGLLACWRVPQPIGELPVTDPAFHAVLPNRRLRPPFPVGFQKCCFAAGCFWGAEKGFWRLPGVHVTAVGYCGGHDFATEPSYFYVCTGDSGHAEAVQVVWDPQIISFGDLLRHFWQSHDPTQGDGQGVDRGSPYRSGIYCDSELQKAAATASLAAYALVLQKHGYPAITTEVKTGCPFWYADDEHQQHFVRAPKNQHHCSAEPTGVPAPPYQEWFHSCDLTVHATDALEQARLEFVPRLPERLWQVFDCTSSASNAPCSLEPDALGKAEEACELERAKHARELLDVEAHSIAMLLVGRGCGYRRRALMLVSFLDRVCDVKVDVLEDPAGPVTGSFELRLRQRNHDSLQLVHSKLNGDGFVDTAAKLKKIVVYATELSGAATDVEKCLAAIDNYQGLTRETLPKLPEEDGPADCVPSASQPGVLLAPRSAASTAQRGIAKKRLSKVQPTRTAPQQAKRQQAQPGRPSQSRSS